MLTAALVVGSLAAIVIGLGIKEAVRATSAEQRGGATILFGIGGVFAVIDLVLWLIYAAIT